MLESSWCWSTVTGAPWTRQLTAAGFMMPAPRSLSWSALRIAHCWHPFDLTLAALAPQLRKLYLEAQACACPAHVQRKRFACAVCIVHVIKLLPR